MTRGRQARMLPVVAGAVVFALFPVQRAIERNLGAMEASQPELLISSGPLLSKLSMGYGSLMADIYWTRVIQYFGKHLANQDSDLRLLAPLLSITVTLDPQLKVAYRFGGIFLSEDAPVGAGRPDQAIALIQRGIDANPNDWQLRYDLGCIHYWHTKDYAAASRAFAAAAKVQGAPEWMAAFAAAVAQKGNSPATSKLLWVEALRTSTDPRLRNNAQIHLDELQVQEDVKALNEAVQDYGRRFGHGPGRLEDLVNVGMLRGIPRDPAGYEYKICTNGQACINSASPWVTRFPSNKGKD
jgi:tetratricopeptide (TPR) repeat protein